MYSQFVQFARAGVVKTALMDESTSTLHFSVDQGKLEQVLRPKTKWYHRAAQRAPAHMQQRTASSTAAATKADKGPVLRQFSTRVIGRDTSFVQVRALALARPPTASRQLEDAHRSVRGYKRAHA